MFSVFCNIVSARWHTKSFVIAGDIKIGTGFGG